MHTLLVRYNRIQVLLVTSALDGLLVLGMALLADASHLPLLYCLLVLQFSAGAFYAPARAALLPKTVRPSDLPSATVIDSFSWSLAGAVASSAGGLLASRLGIRWCFVIDGGTYALSLLCTLRIPGKLGLVAGADGEADPASAGSGASEAGAAIGAEAPHSLGSLSLSLPVAGGFLRALPGIDEAGPEGRARAHAHPQRLLRSLRRSLRVALRSLHECSAYLRRNPDVLWLAAIKGAGALTWGSIDVLNAVLSKLPAMQTLGDAPVPLGIMFDAVGNSALVCPVAVNAFVPARPGALALACAAALAAIAAGHALMSRSATIWPVLGATFVRAAGSAVVWVYSTLALQLVVPDAMLGRLAAWEMAWYTVAEAGSSLAAGLALDLGHLSPHAILSVAAAVAAAIAAAFFLWGRRFAARQGEQDGQGREPEAIALVTRRAGGQAEEDLG